VVAESFKQKTDAVWNLPNGAEQRALCAGPWSHVIVVTGYGPRGPTTAL